MGGRDAPFAAWLRAELGARGWTEAELGRRAGVSQTAASEWARGKATPTRRNLLRLAEALGRPEEEVLAAAGAGPAPAWGARRGRPGVSGA